MNFNILDLFCGAGGFSYGFEKCESFKTKIAVDFNENAIKTLKYNIPSAIAIVGDIQDEKVKEQIIELSTYNAINMIIGGPPCQGFSLKGKNKGLADSRNFLFKEYLDIVAKIKPEIFVIENVKNILNVSNGWFKNEIINSIKNLEYNISYGILSAKDFGIPQSRERAIFICSKTKNIELPKGTNKIVTVRDAISDLAYLNSGEGDFESEYITKPQSEYQKQMRLGSKKLYNHKATLHSETTLKKLSMIPPEKRKEYLPKELLGNQKFTTTWGRLSWDKISPTIDTRFDTPSNGTNSHPELNRAITSREAARIQSFDDKFVFCGSKFYIRTQIGNAVPPLLAKAIGEKIKGEYDD